MTKDTILIVDDEPSVLSAICRALYDEPWDIITELSGEQGLVRIAEQPVKVVISDERMAKMQGSEFLALARQSSPQTVRILLTGHASLEAAINVINNGEVFRFLTKPWDDGTLKQIIRDALRKYDREQDVIKALKILEDNPQLLSNIEGKYPEISKAAPHGHSAVLLSALNDIELEEVLQLLGKIDTTEP
jgi:DNA-binding NtrC family response regulator